jgi:hypothetical protein
MRVRWLPVVIVMLGLSGVTRADDAKDPPAQTPRFTISKETTFALSPIRDDGTVDYVEAINEQLSKGVTLENNAAIPMLKAIAEGDGFQKAHYARIWAKLGVTPAPPTRVGIPNKEPPGFGDTLGGPWTQDKAPAVAQWLTDNAATLDALVGASQRDRYYVPLVREHADDPLVSVLLPHLNVMRHWMNALRSRAMLHLGNEEMDAFCRDTMAVIRLGRLTTHAPTLVENLVGTACETLGLDALKIAATGGWLSEAQVDKLLADLRAMPPRRDMVEAFAGGERGFLLEFLQTAAVHGMDQAKKMLAALGPNNNVMLPPVDPIAKDWNAALRKANGWYDRLEAAGRQPTYSKRMNACALIGKDIAVLKANTEGWKGAFAPLEDRLVVLAMPSMQRAYGAETKLAVNLKLTELAVALSGFRSKTGEYPPELRLLVPTYFKELPTDAFTDQPFTYHQQGNGYILSSPGPDGADGGGGNTDDLIVEVRK